MDHLWSPWRYKYLQKSDAPAGCIFCEKAAQADDERNLIVFRGKLNFILLNLYPYTTGHMMIAPYPHVATLDGAGDETLQEMILLAKRAQRNLETVYKPQGFNVGMNLGESAGAGIADHIHLHVLPRWVGDANFMSTIGETRVLPEDLGVTFGKLRAAFSAVTD